MGANPTEFNRTYIPGDIVGLDYTTNMNTSGIKLSRTCLKANSRSICHISLCLLLQLQSLEAYSINCIGFLGKHIANCAGDQSEPQFRWWYKH